MRKITLEELLNKKLDDGFQSKDVEVKSLGGAITIVKQPLTTIMRIIDELEAVTNTSDKLNVFIGLVFRCVPLFQSKELQVKYNCAEPQDIVLKVLDDNMDDITTLGTAILEFYGLDMEEIQDKVKK